MNGKLNKCLIFLFRSCQATGFDVVRKAISAALDAGYRHIDTAFIYANEADIGVALKEKMTESGIAREDMFITTKVSTLPGIFEN